VGKKSGFARKSDHFNFILSKKKLHGAPGAVEFGSRSRRKEPSVSQRNGKQKKEQLECVEEKSRKA